MAKKKVLAAAVPISKLQFAYAYVINGGNGTDAVLSVHPKIKRQSASVRSVTYLKDQRVQGLIKNLQLQMHGTQQAVVDKGREILKELDIISFFDPRKLFDEGTDERKMLDKLGDSARAVSRIKITRTKFSKKDYLGRKEDVEFDIWINNKLEALKLYGSHHRLYTQVVAGEGNDVKSPVWGIPDNGGSTQVGS